MEVRARAGKNVGKMNFSPVELRQLLHGCGDFTNPLDETMRVVDEIATEFIQGLSFEGARVATHAGRQKLKYEDFEFAMRKSPRFLGRVNETFSTGREIKKLRKMEGMSEGFGDLAAAVGESAKGETEKGKAGRPSKKRKTGKEPAAAEDVKMPTLAAEPMAIPVGGVKMEPDDFADLDDELFAE